MTPPRLLRAPLTLLLTQLLASGWLYLRGFPYYGSSLVANAPSWEAPLALFHAPGLAVLSAAGVCCGMGKGSVLPARSIGGHVPLGPRGLLLLVGANLLCWLLVVTVVAWGWERSRARPAKAARDTDEKGIDD